MSDDTRKSVEAIRKEVHSFLATLTPAQAKILRARFGINFVDPVIAEEEGTLRELARELAMLKKKKTS
jgi:DNA-directed RNA polymerase sigma subunit (sigma70/sigma32)